MIRTFGGRRTDIPEWGTALFRTSEVSVATSYAAPATGKILRVQAKSEGMVTVGTPLLEIGDPADLEVVAEFLSAEEARFKPGAPARLTQWGGEALTGKVRAVEPSGFLKISALGVEEQRVNVIIELETVPAGLSLGDGFRAEAAVTVSSSPNAVRVPVSALFRDKGLWSVFRFSAGWARLTILEIGQQNQVHAEVYRASAPVTWWSFTRTGLCRMAERSCPARSDPRSFDKSSAGL